MLLLVDTYLRLVVKPMAVRMHVLVMVGDHLLLVLVVTMLHVVVLPPRLLVLARARVLLQVLVDTKL
jgi:hypothetical protein